MFFKSKQQKAIDDAYTERDRVLAITDLMTELDLLCYDGGTDLNLIIDLGNKIKGKLKEGDSHLVGGVRATYTHHPEIALYYGGLTTITDYSMIMNSECRTQTLNKLKGK